MEPLQIASILVKAGMYVSVLLAAGSVINLRLLTVQHGQPTSALSSAR